MITPGQLREHKVSHSYGMFSYPSDRHECTSTLIHSTRKTPRSTEDQPPFAHVLVDDMELAHTSRLRSHSSPVRPAEDTYPPELAPESDHTSSVQSVEGEAPERQPHWRSFYSSPPAASDSSRKLFRLKRPSSSSAAMDPNYTSDFQSASLSTTSQPSSRGSGSRSNSRPSTSSGIYERPLRVRSSSSVSESRRDPSIFRAFGPVMGVRSCPISLLVID